MSGQSETERTAKTEKRELYRTEAYISEIRIGGKNVCELKLKPTDDFAVKISETNLELMSLVDMSAWDKGEVEIKRGTKKVIGSFLGTDRYFSFAEEGDAAIVSYDLILSLKQQHVKVQLGLNAKEEILWLTAK